MLSAEHYDCDWFIEHTGSRRINRLSGLSLSFVVVDIEGPDSLVTTQVERTAKPTLYGTV